MQELTEILTEKNIIPITPLNANILKKGMLEAIFDLALGIGKKYSEETFGMMPKLENIQLVTGEVVEGIISINCKKGIVEDKGIFLYDYTKITYEEVKEILEKYTTFK